MFVIRPSDSVLQCHVGRSPQGEDQSINDEHCDAQFSGDDLADDLSWLNISSLPSSPHNATTQPIDMDTKSSPDYPVLFISRKHRSFDIVSGTPCNAADKSSAVVPATPTIRTAYGRDRTAKCQESQVENDQSGLPPDLVNVIFGEITKRRGNKRLAQLQLGDSGRWRLVRYSKAPGAFP